MAGPQNTPPTTPPAPPKQVGGATDKEHPFVLKRILLKVSVRTDFLVRDPFLLKSEHTSDGVQFHYTGEAVPNITVKLANADPVKTDSSGIAKVDVTNVADGNYNVELSNDVTNGTTTDVAGPAVAKSVTTPPTRIFRPLKVPITLAAGKITGAVDPYNPDTAAVWGRIGHSKLHKWKADELPIDYRPSWITSPREHGARDPKTVTLVICHCTGGPIVGHAINTFKGAPGADSDSAHYVVDHDGHIIKFCHEENRVDHAGIRVIWDTADTVNPISVGIEIVHKSHDRKTDPEEIPYNAYQITAVKGLLHSLVNDTDFRIPSHRIVGHSDVDIVLNGDGSLGSRDTDPGQNFQWDTIEADGLGMIPQTGVSMTDAYGGLFTLFPAVKLTSGDSDVAKVWGGGKPKGIPVTAGATLPIQELQEDLNKIGYSLQLAGHPASRITGKYDQMTSFQVKKFQWHFFSHGRKRKADGLLDLETATMIKSVKAGIP